MRMPEFTAEAAVRGAPGDYRRRRSEAGRDAGQIVPATVYIPLESTLFCCDPCMSGGPAGALVTYCCDACGSISPTMSGGRATLELR